MFKKRRSMLGRRHLAYQQLAQNKPVPLQLMNNITYNSGGDGNEGQRNIGSRGKSAKKITPCQYDKPSKDFKKCLFSKSPGINSMFSYRTRNVCQGQDKRHYSPADNFLDETGIASIAPTPKTTPRHAITPATLRRRRIELEGLRYGPLPSTANRAAIKPTLSSTSVQPKPSTYICDLDSLKPPDSLGPSRLERILLEEKLSQTSSGVDFDHLQPPASPDTSRLDKLIMKEKLEQPLDPDLKLQSLSIADPNPRLPFSPPLSSTCIGSPDSGKKNPTVTEDFKETVLHSGRKLSTIREDCDVSVIEFELNERTIIELDNTLMESTKNNTVVKYTHVKTLENVEEENVPEENVVNHSEQSESSWENMLSRLNNMEQAVMDRAAHHLSAIQNIQNQLETVKREIQNDCQQDISNVRSMKGILESFQRSSTARHSSEDKENSFQFKVPTCKKAQLDEDLKWFNRVKKENPGLLKTPNSKINLNQSSVWTPRSLSRVVCNQISELYDD